MSLKKVDLSTLQAVKKQKQKKNWKAENNLQSKSIHGGFLIK